MSEELAEKIIDALYEEFDQKCEEIALQEKDFEFYEIQCSNLWEWQYLPEIEYWEGLYEEGFNDHYNNDDICMSDVCDYPEQDHRSS